MIIYLFCLLVVLFAFRSVRKNNLIVPEDVEGHVVDVLANVNNANFTEVEEGDGFANVGKRGRFQSKLVLLAKAEFGLISRSKANRMMVRKFLRDHMRDRGMRPSHIAEHLDVSVSCFFIPSNQDLIAHQVGASKISLAMEDLIKGEWESFFGPLGRMLGFTDS
jgi:hypothetical protein